MLSRCSIGIAIVFLLYAGAPRAQEAETWAIDADISEACSCDIPCPCIFGSMHTRQYCEGSRLFEIKSGRVGDVELDGLRVLVAFRVGQWVRYAIDERATDEQRDAVPALISRAAPALDTNILSLKRAPIAIEKSGGRIKFSGPDSKAEIERTPGRDGGPIIIRNLADADLADYVQYRAIAHSHDSADVSFDYKGTNGFTSKVKTEGSIE